VVAEVSNKIDVKMPNAAQAKIGVPVGSGRYERGHPRIPRRHDPAPLSKDTNSSVDEINY